MKNFAATRERYLRDPLPVRLGGLAADLARIGSTAQNSANARVVEVLLEEARRFIEWTAAEVEPKAASDLVDLQLILALWLRAWPEAQTNSIQRALLAQQGLYWSDQVLEMSGLLDTSESV